MLITSTCRSATTPGPTGTSSIRPSSVRPSPSGEEGLCQPFPDKLIDDFIAAYQHRDLEALTALVRVQEIHDVTALAHADRAVFDDVAAWAEAGWAVDDRLVLAGYGAFAGGPDGFVMYLERTNDGLQEAGITELALLLQARSTGCTIDELDAVGPAQARGAPCRFYEVFGDIPEVAAVQPSGCGDGSGAFARLQHAAVWIGDEMVLVAGSRGAHFQQADLWDSGLRYGPGVGWRPTAEAPRAAVGLTRAAWTGREVLVWGGWYDDAGAAAYDPAADRWRVLRGWPLRPSDDAPGVWTGKELLVWGSSTHTDRPERSGAIYDLLADSWRRTRPAPIGGRDGHVAVWTGEEMVVWGGSDHNTDLKDGAAYDPATDSWRTIPPAPLSPRQDASAVWTGQEMIVWGGTSFSRTRADGAAFDPDTNAWRRLPRPPIQDRHWHTAVWTGRRMIVWGGHSYRSREVWSDGAAYDPGRNRWRVLPEPLITPRCHHSAVWTGAEMIVYGGYAGCGSGGHLPFGDGAAYDPDSETWERLNPAA